jgi:hypothetical protein
MLMLLALCATVIPAVALAQAGPGAGVRPPPSPEQRAMMEKLRTDAKATAYGALTPAHRDRVTAIVADVAAGKQDRAAAAKLIDDVLTPDEQKAVRDAAAAAFRARRMAMGGPPPGPPNAAQPGPNGPPRADGPPRAFGPDGGRFSPSAGRYLLMVSMSREQMRNTMPRARSGSAS